MVVSHCIGRRDPSCFQEDRIFICMRSKASSCLCDLKRVICPTIHLPTRQGHHESNCLPLQRRPGLGSDSYETSFLVVETLSFRLSASIYPLSRIMWVVNKWIRSMSFEILVFLELKINISIQFIPRNHHIRIEHNMFIQTAFLIFHLLPLVSYVFLNILLSAILSLCFNESWVQSYKIFSLLYYRAQNLCHWSTFTLKNLEDFLKENLRNIVRIYFPYVRMSQFISVEMNSFSCHGLFSSADHRSGASLTIQFFSSLKELFIQKK